MKYTFGRRAIFFYFSDVSATQAINVKLIANPGVNLSKDSFINDLPYIRNAFFEAIKDLEENIKNIAGEKLAEELIILVKQLCEPDPRLRGDPKTIGTIVSQYDLQRFISNFNLLARRAELGLR